VSASPRPTDLDPDAAQAVVDYGYEQGWSDGLPLAPATQPLVDRFLAAVDRDPDEVIGRLEHLDRSVTVGLAAINAAMAGCLPEYFPVVLAAWEALQLDRASSGAAWQSTSGPAPLLVVNGPVRDELGVNSSGGVFGPGFRANATIPRAIGLIVRNAYGILPHQFEQATQGIPGRWSICIGENEESSPWDPLAVDGGLEPGTSAVSATLLRTSEFVDNRHTQDPEQLLRDFADTVSRTGAWIFAHHAVGIVFCPEHAQMLAEAGYSKDDVRAWLFEHAGRTEGELAGVGKDDATGARKPGQGAGSEVFAPTLPSASPEDVLIAVAGARNAGISMVVRLFTRWSARSIPVVSTRSS
jgi:hypothetical protein